MADNDPPGRGLYRPQGHDGRIYTEDHYTLLLTKYESFGTCGLGDFFSHCKVDGSYLLPWKPQF